MTATGEAARIRRQARLSQAEIGHAADVPVSTLSRWERGERRPTGDAALRYCALLENLAAAMSPEPSAA